MRDNVKNFRETSNIMLKDIYVTDELKRETLEKCVNKKQLKVKPLFAATVSAAVLIVTLGLYNYFYHKSTFVNNYIDKSVKHEYKYSINNENLIKPTKNAKSEESDKSQYLPSNNNIDPNTKKSGTTLQNKGSNINTYSVNKDTASQNIIANKPLKPSDNVLQDETGNNENEDISISSQVPNGLTVPKEPLNISNAEKYFESKILLPSNIPKGFKLTDIWISEDKSKCVKLRYDSDSAFFEILQSKNPSELEGTKTIFIGNNKAYISSIKDEKSNIIITKISWIMNDIEYSLSGNLSEDSIMNIAKSIVS